MKKFYSAALIIFFHLNVSAQNVGIGVAAPVAKLEVSGGLKASAEYYSTSKVPTAAQTFTLVNASTSIMLTTDSIARVYDPGGPSGNYVANSTSNFNINTSSAVNSYLELQIETLQLGTGDSLIIYDGTNVSAPVLFKIGNGASGSNIVLTFSQNGGYCLFKSNSDASVGAGFSLLFKRKYQNNSATEQPVATGVGLNFYPLKGAFRAGMQKGGVIGSYSAAFGNSSEASGQYSFAAGNTATASGSAALSFGHYTTSTGSYSTSLGYFSNASGSGSTALGWRASATGSFSFATGYETEATTFYASAFGRGTKATSLNSFVVGRYNIDSGDPSNWINSDPLFVVGNGSNDTDRKNALVVNKNGYTTLSHVLDVKGSTYLRGNTRVEGELDVENIFNVKKLNAEFSAGNIRNINLVPVGVVSFSASYHLNPVLGNTATTSFENLAGNLVSTATGLYDDGTLPLVDAIVGIRLSFNPSVVADYKEIIAVGQSYFDLVGTSSNAEMIASGTRVDKTSNSPSSCTIQALATSFPAYGGVSARGTYMFYGLK